jgi:hypothetical protein
MDGTSTPLFPTLTPSQIARVTAHGSTRAIRPGEVLFDAGMQTDAELVARGFGDVVLVLSAHSSATLRIKEFLTRNGHPYAYLDLERDPDVQELLDRFHAASPTCRC